MRKFLCFTLAAVLSVAISSVGLAESRKDIVDTAISAGSFHTLVTAVKAAGLVDALKSEGPFTVFAPTDEAFAKLPKGTIPALLKDKHKLQEVLKYHVVSGKVTAADVVKLSSAATLQGQPVSISTCSGVKINDSKVIKTDILTSNGVIHVIDSVLLPPEPKADAKAARDMIRHAVAKGAPMFNRGHHSACAKVYQMTATTLMKRYGDNMPETVRSDLASAMEKAEHSHCPASRAWALRHGLDAVYMAMSELE
jgi:uncharacterized surface protein with fasciclin (FAS1) repeats